MDIASDKDRLAGDPDAELIARQLDGKIGARCEQQVPHVVIEKDPDQLIRLVAS
jgi:hypothetical protein